MTDMTKKRLLLTDRQCSLFLRDIREFGYRNCTFEDIRRIADDLAEGKAKDTDVVAIIMAREIDDAMEARAARRR